MCRSISWQGTATPSPRVWGHLIFPEKFITSMILTEMWLISARF